MSWTSEERRSAMPNEKYTPEGAADYFRSQDLEPMRVGGPCPYCKASVPGLEFLRVDVDERMDKRIGGYRFGRCDGCNALCVVITGVAMRKVKEAGWAAQKYITTDEQYRELMDGWCTKNGWVDSNGRSRL